MENMENEYHVDFIGPFSWLGHEGTKSIFDAPEGKKSGIYLWTVRLEEENGELVYYVGKTNRSFSQRMREHFKEHLAGFYHVYSPEEFRKGKRNPEAMWGGMYLRHRSPAIVELAKIYPTISSQIIELANTYRFFIAPIYANQRILERIEYAFAKHLYDQPGKIGEFQERGLNYRSRLPSEQIGMAFFSSSSRVLGLPEQLEI
jgi:hypothetical protein